MKQYSFLQKSITQDKESYILDNIVYHGSPDMMKNIKGNRTSDKRFGFNCVFVTAFKWMAGLFIVNSELLYKEIVKRYPEIKGNVKRIIWCYKTIGLRTKCGEKLNNPTWKKKMQTTYDKNSIVDVFMWDLKDNPIMFKDFNCDFTGYIYYIDYNKYKDKAYQDNEKPFEFVIRDNVKPFKYEKIKVSFLVKSYEWKK